ncbi:MAG: hypothetical protein E7Z89_07650 [Cyanobacteria bacterium SIG28]|nr:hypothetical protein [Cyanobacteria bacterium SIG28]
MLTNYFFISFKIIMRINSGNNCKVTPTFSAWNRTVYRPTKARPLIKEVAYRNDTSFFRGDLMWDKFIKFLTDKYQDVSKVNVYNYACSNGSEPFSIIMKLLSTLGEKESEKFFPIIAKDIDTDAIKIAKSNSLPIDWYEKTSINYHTNNKFDLYFTKDPLANSVNEEQFYYQTSNNYIQNTSGNSNDFEDNQTFYFPAKSLTERVEFSKRDIFEDYKNINPENSVVLVRNFWPYLEHNIPKLISKLAEQMGKNSTLVIGGFDVNACENFYGINLIRELIKKGFISTDEPFVFEKRSQLGNKHWY